MRDYTKPQLFEISWEVANRGMYMYLINMYFMLFFLNILVGGIYTVLKTKVPITIEEYGKCYCLIGPLSKTNSSFEVELCEPEDIFLKESLNEMRDAGLKVSFGKWLIEGSPSVILFDLEAVIHRLNEWKSDLWNLSKIPCPSNDQEMNDAVLFGYLTEWFIGLVIFMLNNFI